MEDDMFKKGDKVKCIDNAGFFTHLTLGKVYTVKQVKSVFEDSDAVVILDDNENVISCDIGIFELVEESNTFKFQLGDIVEFGGLEGEVDRVIEDTDFPIRVAFENGTRDYFTTDGRLQIIHTKPLLNLVSRPKKKEKRIVKTTVQYSPSLDRVFTGLEVKQPEDCILVELEKEIEVEV